jgi:hypothetical protein
LRDALAKQLDLSLFSTTAGDTTQPAGVINGVSRLDRRNWWRLRAYLERLGRRSSTARDCFRIRHRSFSVSDRN